MPEPQHPGDRTPAQRQADHASLARLSETLVPALVAKLTGTGLGEVEVREGDWRIRVRRPLGAPPAAPLRRSERPRLGGQSGGHAEPRSPKAAQAVEPADPDRAVATSPAVGVFRPGVAIGTAVHAGDRIAIVDLLGIPQDVTSPIDGRLVELFVQAGEAVEYGEEIGAIEADAPSPAAGDEPTSAAADAPTPAAGEG
ncbi:MAG TPA: biotin/lipoyl-containing protein [Candidatus Limnocylindrales bacterium]|jgi:biotin carboxyl carrier protein